jgi:hypothetical protein
MPGIYPRHNRWHARGLQALRYALSVAFPQLLMRRRKGKVKN